jgi:hypothetical protein
MTENNVLQLLWAVLAIVFIGLGIWFLVDEAPDHLTVDAWQWIGMGGIAAILGAATTIRRDYPDQI